MWVDAEALTVAYLKSNGLGVPGFTDLPELLPQEFVHVMLTGSGRRTVVQRACELAEQVYALIDGWELVPVFGGWAAGPYPQPDPETGCPRYVMTFIARHRSEA